MRKSDSPTVKARNLLPPSARHCKSGDDSGGARQRKSSSRSANASGQRPILRGEARRRGLAEVAEKVFLERGFSEATMQMIAREARASKETIYRHFTSKEALFCEIVNAKVAQIFGPSGAPAVEEAPASVLRRVGVGLLRTLLRRESLALLRLVVAESARAPHLGRLFWSQGPQRVQEQLTAYLREGAMKGRLRCPDPLLACRLFLGSVIAANHMAALVAGPEAGPSDEAIVRHVDEAVALFLARYEIRPPDAARI